jgi:tetratricopeptide (TPR) repeat protein
VSFLRSEKRFHWVKFASNLKGGQWGGRLLSCQADLRRFLGSASGASKSVKKLLDSSLVSLYADFVSSTEKQKGPSHLQTIATLQSLAVVYGWTGDAARSVKMLESLLTRQWVENSLLRLEILIELGAAYHARRRFDDSITVLTEAWESRKKEFGDEDPIFLKAHDRLAGVHQSQGKYPLAEKMYTHSLAIRTAIDPCHPETLVVANNLGLLYKAQKRWAESEKLLRHVVSSHETLYDRLHQHLSGVPTT